MILSEIKSGVELAQLILSATSSPSCFEGDPDDVAASIQQHGSETRRWSEVFQIAGMTRPRSVGDNTAELSISTEPRRFRTKNAITVKDTELLEVAGNFVLLGELGSGKTTALKRIINRLLTSSNSEYSDSCDYCILIIARDLDRKEDLFSAVLRKLGLHRISPDAGSSLDDIRRLDFNTDALRILHHAFRDIGLLLIIDGFDEIPHAQQTLIAKQCVQLSRALPNAQVGISCRTGVLNWNMEGFELYELLPLSPDELHQFASKWTDNADKFTEIVSKEPYKELLNRPLFLTHALLIFNQYGSIPRRPAEIYRKITSLMLEDWDRHQGIERATHYADFTSEQKKNFLADLAHHRLRQSGFKSFTSLELKHFYHSRCKAYQLPPEEVEKAISEIESHTGVIAQYEHGEYNFSHNALQEYLAADYIVRSSNRHRSMRQIQESPEVIALVVALAAEPSAMLAKVCDIFRDNLSSASFSMFFYRLVLECPPIVPSAELGQVLFELFSKWSVQKLSPNEHLMAFLTNPTIGSQLEDCILEYCSNLDILHGERSIKAFEKANSTQIATHEILKGTFYSEILNNWLDHGNSLN